MKKLVSLILVMAMVLSLCACGKADDYEAAIALMEAGNYEEAIAAFTELGDYEDSAQKLEECENILSYAEAVALFEAEQYEEALAILSSLGNYKDSAEKVKECEIVLAYNKAVALIAEGYYVEARDIFETIPDYKDVSEYLARYKTIEITPENWSEYFEIVEVPLFCDNDFNEVECFFIAHCVVLKENFTPQLCADSDFEVLFEIEYDCSLVSLDVDVVAHTFSHMNDSSYFGREKGTAKYTLNALTSASCGMVFTDFNEITAFPIENAFVSYYVYYNAGEGSWISNGIWENVVASKTSGSITLFE